MAIDLCFEPSSGISPRISFSHDFYLSNSTNCRSSLTDPPPRHQHRLQFLCEEEQLRPRPFIFRRRALLLRKILPAAIKTAASPKPPLPPPHPKPRPKTSPPPKK
ncbi:unnamed protein product [Linum trigynum]|uniref:Uncharacterized protein n=1 Tax=Linum trigynum TaxID=586398 RepID=A0AAV2FUX3_9ROSI